MKRYYFKSLRTRLTTLLVLPVILILLSAGLGGFLYARDRMIKQWHKNITLRLERTAHEIEMRLSKPIELMTLFSNSGKIESNIGLLAAIVQSIETIEGVVRVNLKWHTETEAIHHHGGRDGKRGRLRMMNFNRGSFSRISLPTVDEISSEQTVSITMILLDNSDAAVGNLEIVLKFSFLVSNITTNPWWQSATACIVDRATGRIILPSGLMKGRVLLGETGNSLERSLKSELSQKTVGTLWGEGNPPDHVAGFHSLQTFPWALVVFAEGKTILAPIINFRNGFMVGAFFLIIIVMIIINLNIGRMSATIRSLAKRSTAVAAGDYGEKIEVNSGDEMGQLTESFNTMIEGLKEKQMIQRTFGHYVDPDFARSLLKAPESGQLGGRRQEVTVLITDIRDFTPMTENLSPEDTIEVLNEYFSTMIPLIQRYRGIIVDFVGDGILAFFEPVNESLSNATGRCLLCAFEMQRSIEKLDQVLIQRNLSGLKMGIGIHCGPVVVGNIGSETRKKYGIVGAAVNISQRIQGKAEAGEVLVSKSVLDMVERRVIVARDFSASLKGVASTMQLYAVLPDQKLA